MNRIEHHLLNMYVITTYLLRLRKHQYLKRSIYFCVKVGRNHRRDVNHLPFLQNSKKCFGTRSIDKFSFRISTRRMFQWLRAESVINRSTTSELKEPGQKCIEAEHCMSLCFNGKTLTYLSRYFLLPFVCVENAIRNLTS